MARGINDFGNGIGYLYETLLDGVTITATAVNDENGARVFKRLADVNAPIAAPRSAVGILTITGCASAGNVTAININGVNQLAGAVACATSVNATFAAVLAAAINAFTPGSGPNFTAISVGANILIFSPVEDGSAVNGQAITLSASVGSITSTSENFVGGASNQGTYDTSTGRRYWVDSDYGVSQITGSTPADPTNKTYALEITSDITDRGMQVGAPVFNVVISGDALNTIDRYSNKIVLFVDTEGGAGTDILAQINTQKFINGDELIILCQNPAHVVTVQSAEVTTGIAPTPNIYLSGQNNYVIDSKSKALRLLFKYDSVLGPIFTESSRSASTVVTVGKQNYMAFFNEDTSIKDDPSFFYDQVSKKHAMSQMDIQGTPSLLANIDAIFNIIVSSLFANPKIISALLDGADNSHAFKITLVDTNGGGVGESVYSIDAEWIYIWPGDLIANGVSIFKDGDLMTGLRTSLNDIVTGSALFLKNGLTIGGLNKGVHIVDDATKAILPPNQIADADGINIYNPIASPSNNYWQYKVVSLADNSSGTGYPRFTIQLRMFDKTNPTVDLASQVIMQVDYLNQKETHNLPLEQPNSSGVAQMVSGTVTVVAPLIQAGAKIFALHAASPSAPGHLYPFSITPGAGFVLKSTAGADTGPVNWWFTI